MPYSLDKEVSQDKGIAVNRNAIATNAADIATNSSNIATNSSNIATNSSDITGLDSRLTIAESTLTDHETRLGTMVADNNYYQTWGNTYTVSNTVILPLLMSDNSSLEAGGIYTFTAHIDATGTDQSSRAVFWNENGTWRFNVTGQSSESSNHIQFLVSGGVPSIKTYHASTYDVHVLHERINLYEGTGNDNTGHGAGADSFISNINGNLAFNSTGATSTYTSSDGSKIWHSTVDNTTTGTVTVGGTLSANGGLSQDGHTILNGTDTWLRTAGNQGWYSDTYGGGIRCSDTTYVEIYNNRRLKIISTAADSLTTIGGLRSTKAQTSGVDWSNPSLSLEPVGGTTNTTGRTTMVMGASTSPNYGYSLNVHRTAADATSPAFHINHHYASTTGTERLRIAPTLITLEGQTNVTGTLTAPTLRAGDGTDGRFYSDAAGRTAFADGSLYLQTSVPVFYNYATATYHGDTSGNAQYFRGNTLTGNSWSLTGPGVLSTTGLINANGGLAQDGHNILNGSDTWLRTLGSDGWYSATYGGGIQMTDATYVQIYNSKAFKVNATGSGAIQCAGGINADGESSRFGGTGSNLGVVYIDTSHTGSPQITLADGTTGQDMSWAVGGDDDDNNFKIHGNASATVPVIAGLVKPHFEINVGTGVTTLKTDTIWTGNTTARVTLSSHLPADLDAADLALEFYSSSSTAAGNTSNNIGHFHWQRGRICFASFGRFTTSGTGGDTNTSNGLLVYSRTTTGTTNYYLKSIKLLKGYIYG